MRPDGDFTWCSFYFRCGAGSLFSVLFLRRGFGIAVGTPVYLKRKLSDFWTYGGHGFGSFNNQTAIARRSSCVFPARLINLASSIISAEQTRTKGHPEDQSFALIWGLTQSIIGLSEEGPPCRVCRHELPDCFACHDPTTNFFRFHFNNSTNISFIYFFA